MFKRRLNPIIISVLMSIIGIICLVLIYNYWNNQTVNIANPIVSEIQKDETTTDLKSIIYETEENVVQIEGQNEFDTLTGSGFIYNEQGDIITNAHVIRDSNVIYVRTSNARIYPAAVVEMSDDIDIAVIRVPQLAGKSIPPIGDDSVAEVGDEVIALGSPHGFQNTVTLGIISGEERNFSVDGFDYENVYQISAQITHGNSGGPLVNRETGEIIGVNSVGTEDGTIGFSIPVHDFIDKVESWSKETQDEDLDFANTTDIVNKFNPEQLSQDAEYLIEYFLDSINERDYSSAYDVLGDDLQSKTSYSEFRESVIDIISLEYDDFSNELIDENEMENTVNITIERKQKDSNKTKSKKFKSIFTVGYENEQLTILQMKN